MAKKKKLPKVMSVVQFDFDSIPIDMYSSYPFSKYDNFIYLGDILQMPGHCVIVHIETGQVMCCYHTDNFIEVLEKDI